MIHQRRERQSRRIISSLRYLEDGALPQLLDLIESRYGGAENLSFTTENEQVVYISLHNLMDRIPGFIEDLERRGK
jgi:hypothetical protein